METKWWNELPVYFFSIFARISEGSLSRKSSVAPTSSRWWFVFIAGLPLCGKIKAHLYFAIWNGLDGREDMFFAAVFGWKILFLRFLMAHQFFLLPKFLLPKIKKVKILLYKEGPISITFWVYLIHCIIFFTFLICEIFKSPTILKISSSNREIKSRFGCYQSIKQYDSFFM